MATSTAPEWKQCGSLGFLLSDNFIPALGKTPRVFRKAKAKLIITGSRPSVSPSFRTLLGGKLFGRKYGKIIPHNRSVYKFLRLRKALMVTKKILQAFGGCPGVLDNSFRLLCEPGAAYAPKNKKCKQYGGQKNKKIIN